MNASVLDLENGCAVAFWFTRSRELISTTATTIQIKCNSVVIIEQFFFSILRIIIIICSFEDNRF